MRRREFVTGLGRAHRRAIANGEILPCACEGRSTNSVPPVPEPV
jgi:hypothetical protein